MMTSSADDQKIIKVQKAKILALQTELEDALKKMNLMEIEIDDKANKKNKDQDDVKRNEEKVMQMTAQITKLKATNQE